MAVYTVGEEPDSALGRLFYYSEAGKYALFLPDPGGCHLVPEGGRTAGPSTTLRSGRDDNSVMTAGT
jgi:hypothetical protein